MHSGAGCVEVATAGEAVLRRAQRAPRQEARLEAEPCSVVEGASLSLSRSLSADAVPSRARAPLRAGRMGCFAEPAFLWHRGADVRAGLRALSAEVMAAPCAAQLTAKLPNQEERDIDQKVSQPVLMEQSQISEPFDGGLEVSEADEAERGRVDADEGSALPTPAAVPWVPCGLPLGPGERRLFSPMFASHELPAAVGQMLGSDAGLLCASEDDGDDPPDAFGLGGFRS
ncbi:unnamed protein product [Prorocentrum cordatum]|uniref:Uncharacterized protein n=1 Tax=Prorocentrum cordatum TaxID=2364126 RepID=A0ABN9V0U4_9DINO|nr:unnamed protein product [Polarella glacialis]